MKTRIFILSFFILLGCKPNSRVVLSNHTNGQVHELLLLDKPITNDSIGTKFIYFENGDLQCEGGYKNGRKHGDWVCYTRNGKIKWKGTYLNGVENGEIYCAYDHNTWIKLTTIDGIKNGKTIEYNYDSIANRYFYINGQYTNNLEEGSWQYSDTLGMKFAEVHYQNGMPLDTIYVEE